MYSFSDVRLKTVLQAVAPLSVHFSLLINCGFYTNLYAEFFFAFYSVSAWLAMHSTVLARPE